MSTVPVQIAITVNEKKRLVAQGTTLADLAQRPTSPDTFLLNGRPVPADEWPQILLTDDDTVVIAR